MNWILALLAISFAAASFFWLRGIWRDRRLDCAIGLILLLFSCIYALGLSGTSDLLNLIGLCIMALGAATIVAGRLGRSTPMQQVNTYSVLFILVGLFLALLL
jgi:hypothetical protein